jgi:hypothetical protein
MSSNNHLSSNNHYGKYDLAYSDRVYFPESLLDGWLAVSSVLLTTSLLFYHMSRVKSIKVEPLLAKVICIGLIAISTAYMFYALLPYTKRMNYTINLCKQLDECSDEQTKELNILKWSYLFLGGFTLIIQCIIIYLVFTTI